MHKKNNDENDSDKDNDPTAGNGDKQDSEKSNLESCNETTNKGKLLLDATAVPADSHIQTM